MKHFFVGILETLKKEGLIFIIFLVACFTHNMDRGSIVYVALMAVILIKMLISPSRRLLDRTVFLLLLFGFFYVIISPRFDFENAVRVLLGPSFFYVYGRYTVARASYNQDHIQKMILLMIVSLSFPMWWAVISNMLQGNIVSTTSDVGARWLETWGQSKMAAATLYGLIASFGLCGLGVFFMMKAELKDITRWLFLVCGICSILSVLYLINRGGLVIAIIGLVVAIFYRSHGNVGKFLLFAAFVFIIFALFFSENILPSEFAESYSERESVAEGGNRTWRWIDAISRMFYMPFGWVNDSSLPYGYVHNTWLDIARDAGIFPFIFFLLPTIQSIKTGIRLIKTKDNNLCLCLITLYVCVFFAYFIEPVFESNIFYIMLFTWLWGVMKEYSLITTKRVSLV
jgi:hypothetical protein